VPERWAAPATASLGPGGPLVPAEPPDSIADELAAPELSAEVAESSAAAPPAVPRSAAALPRRRWRRARTGAVLAVAVPAALAGGLVLVTGGSPEDRPPGVNPPVEKLLRLAERGAGFSPLRGERPPAAEVVAVRADPAAALGAATPRPDTPARISIPAARVSAVVEGVAATKTGMAVPSVDRAGWFSAGPRPGEAGLSVVIGHRDSPIGAGVFADVPDLQPGEGVEVTDADGEVHRYAVVGSTQVEKSRFPVEAVFAPSERPVLVLITCSGPWDPHRGYRDNVLVYARAT